MIVISSLVSSVKRILLGVSGAEYSVKSAKPTMSFDQVADVLGVGSNLKNVEDVLGQPQVVTHRNSKEIRNYVVKSNTHGSVEFFTGVFEAGRLVKTRHAVISGNI